MYSPRAWFATWLKIRCKCSTDKFGIKPAGRSTVGILQQNLLSPHVKISAFHPVIAYAFPKGWSISTGQQQRAFGWENGGGL